MEKGWHKREREHSNFSKSRSKTGTLRSNAKTYTLKGREMSVFQTLRSIQKQSKAFATLGSGNLLAIVEVPEDMINDNIAAVGDREPDMELAEMERIANIEAKKEWLAANTVDFFNELSLLYGMVESFHVEAARRSTYEDLVKEYKEKKPPVKLPPFNNGMIKLILCIKTLF